MATMDRTESDSPAQAKTRMTLPLSVPSYLFSILLISSLVKLVLELHMETSAMNKLRPS